jgi:hypothetical protein
MVSTCQEQQRPFERAPSRLASSSKLQPRLFRQQKSAPAEQLLRNRCACVGDRGGGLMSGQAPQAVWRQGERAGCLSTLVRSVELALNVVKQRRAQCAIVLCAQTREGARLDGPEPTTPCAGDARLTCLLAQRGRIQHGATARQAFVQTARMLHQHAGRHGGSATAQTRYATPQLTRRELAAQARASRRRQGCAYS